MITVPFDMYLQNWIFVHRCRLPCVRLTKVSIKDTSNANCCLRQKIQKAEEQTFASNNPTTARSTKQSLMLCPKMSATAVGGAKQNPIQMSQTPQLLTPSAWTVHPLEVGLVCLPWRFKAWRLGPVTLIADTVVHVRPQCLAGLFSMGS